MVSYSEQNYAQFISNSKLSKDAKRLEILNRIGQRVTKATEEFMMESGLESQLKYFDWEYNLIDDDRTINAFAMPGGKIAFYTGIMKLADNEDQIAVVMGHEIAHVIAKHGNERMSQMMLVELGGAALDSALQDNPDETRNIFMTAYGLGSQVGVMLPYSRKHEYEADEIGLILMAKAGYNPEEAVYFWENMKKFSGSGAPEFISTHPATTSRINHIKKMLPEVKQYQKQN
jgi:predicted Zn-dependent protease